MVSENDIFHLMKYIDIYLFKPSMDWKKEDIDKRLYERWIADEILSIFSEENSRLPEYITGREEQTALDILNDYRSYIDSIASINTDNQMIFIIALETIDKIIEYLEKAR